VLCLAVVGSGLDGRDGVLMRPVSGFGLNGHVVERLAVQQLQAEVLDGRQLGVSLGVQPEVPEVEPESVVGVVVWGGAVGILITVDGFWRHCLVASAVIRGRCWARLKAECARLWTSSAHSGAVASRGRETTSVGWRSALDSRCLISKGIGGVCPDVWTCPSNWRYNRRTGVLFPFSVFVHMAFVGAEAGREPRRPYVGSTHLLPDLTGDEVRVQLPCQKATEPVGMKIFTS